jgi:hypothetical protein
MHPTSAVSCKFDYLRKSNWHSEHLYERRAYGLLFLVFSFSYSQIRAFSFTCSAMDGPNVAALIQHHVQMNNHLVIRLVGATVAGLRITVALVVDGPNAVPPILLLVLNNSPSATLVLERVSAPLQPTILVTLPDIPLAVRRIPHAPM